MGRPQEPETEAPREALLEGAWKNTEGSAYFMRMVDSRLRCVYSYRGARRTGEVVDWTVRGGSFLARYRWFNSRVTGLMMLKLVSRDRLIGGWWPASEATSLEAASISPNQVACVWERYEAVKIPQWAEEYFQQRMWDKR